MSADTQFPQTVSYLLKNIDSVYASGMFCKIGPSRSRDDHYKVISSVRGMLGELAIARESALESKSPIFHARRLIMHHITNRFSTSGSPQSQDPISERLRRELRLHVKATKRVQQGKPRSLAATFENIDKIYTLLSTSLEFFDDAKEWHGMPWWRNSQAELKPFLTRFHLSLSLDSPAPTAPTLIPASPSTPEYVGAIHASPPPSSPPDLSDHFSLGSRRSDPSVVSVETLQPVIRRSRVSFHAHEKPSSVAPSPDHVPSRSPLQSSYQFPAS